MSELQGPLEIIHLFYRWREYSPEEVSDLPIVAYLII